MPPRGGCIMTREPKRKMKFEFSSLIKKYGDKVAVDGFSYVFDIMPGKRLAVCGPSGCGKSTILSIISGLDKDYSGSFAFTGGEPRISLSMQDPTLLPWLTAAENVNLVTGDRRESLETARGILRELGLAGHENDYPDELSGGMQTRVSIARALAREADLYLFDEPFAALDIATAELCIEVIKRRTAHAAAIAVIHSRTVAEKFADGILTFTSVPAGRYTLD